MTKDTQNTELTKTATKDRTIPVSIEKEETRSKILSELIRAEDYYVKKIQSARHSIAHEVLSDSSAIIGAVTTFGIGYFKSLLAVTPIIGMLLWDRMQAKSDLKRLHRVAELFRKTRDPIYFHALGLELEGIPHSEDLTWEQKLQVEKDIKSILGKPVSFGSTLKNLRNPPAQEEVEKVSENLNRFSIEQAKEVGRKLIDGAEKTGIFLLETVKDLKNLTTLPKNYLQASFVIASQVKDVFYLPMREQFVKAATPVKSWIAKRQAVKVQEEKSDGIGETVARIKRSKTATFAADPYALNREIKRVKESMRRTTIDSTVNGIAFVCQTAFIVNQAILTHSHAIQGQWGAALFVALPSLLALSPLNYFAKNQIDKNRQIKSSRAEMATRLDQHAKTLEAVEKVKKMVGQIQKEKDEQTHLKMAEELVGMFGDDFNPEWFEQEHRQKLEKLFNLVASAHSSEAKAEAIAQLEAEPTAERAVEAAAKEKPRAP